ncbi:uncharacterized protein LOC118460990 [Anopheles albimanus]|uniref:RFX-type winged-helix domain-containing protein n=1 Tax=Anopheles albimanus TaxID=7167 RepID=A0A8W7JWC1_ANOAL|nr:uncharacterized protein LOC118460990 [Anopheles albimanus]
MSQANSFQPWKQTLPVGLPSNLSSAIFGAGGGAVGYGKAAAQPQPPPSIPNQQQQPSSGAGACPPLQPSPSSSSSSSSASSTVPAHGAERGRREMSLLPGAPAAGGPPHGGGGSLSSFHSTGSTAAIHNGTGSDFLAQVAVNKLKLGKLNTSYELTAAAAAAAATNQPIATPSDDGGGLHDLGSDPNVAAMRTLLANAAGQTGTGPLGDKEREHQIQQLFEKTVSDNTKKQIVEILDKISVLRPPERLLLYLRMPGGYPETDPLRQSQNPLGTRLEINHTINWVRSHLEHDPNVSIPKQEVYDDYVAYCARINIKPLSTADFGKVMKQVFPGIRPRRLGTRGHSRYCYAAMRKATKLPTPKLPDLTDPNGGPSELKNGGGGGGNGGNSANLSDEESWKVIKTWAEAMLPACFDSINDLAAFIAKNNLNSPTGNTSRQQLQKKILQREMKEKRKLSAVALKKRRKKRRRTISTSISEATSELRNGTPEADCSQQPEAFGLAGTVSTKQTATIGQQQQQPQPLHPSSMVQHQLLLQQHMIKREQQDCLDEDNNNTTTSGALGAGAASGKLLILQRQQQQQQSTNLNCDSRGDTGAFESIGKELLAAASYSGDAQVHGQSLMGPTNHLPPTPPQSLQQPQLIHQRLLEAGEDMRTSQEQTSFLGNVYCKKVRQAQQLKAVQQQQQQQQQQLQQQLQQQHLAPPHPLHQQQLFFPNRPASASKRQLSNSLGYASRQKRLKLLQARQQRSLESQNNSAPRYDEQGNLILIESQDPSRDEFIIPRERVISICNMDKNALDDYLNCEGGGDDEENSQDQDQELLKYFPQEEEEDTVLANVGGVQPSSVGLGSATPTSTTTQDADTTTGGYGGTLADDCEQKLCQIRMILEKNQSNQNKQQQQSMAGAQLGNASSGSSAACTAGYEHQSGMSLPAGSAAASLAMLSQRHNTHGGATVSVPEPSASGKQKFCGTLDLKQCSASSSGGTIDGGTGYELAGGPSTMALQSPTARRRNCSFVPISQPSSGGKQHLHQQQHQTPNVSPFVSPRSTPIHRKPPKGPSNSGHTLNMLEAKLNHQLQQQQQQQLQSSGGPFLQQHLHHQQQQHQPQHQQQQSFRSSGSVYIKNELPASAPPSPSLMQPFRFVSSMGSAGAGGGSLNCGALLSQPTAFQPIAGPHQQQLQTANINSSTTTTTTPGGLPMSLESRSSSVPLIPNYDSYCNSSYNSVSQTPVPSEYDDFTDTGILDMLTEQSSAQLNSSSSIKIEDTELSMLPADLLDQQQTLQNQDQDRASSGGGGFYSRGVGGDGSGSIFNIISRSVPSTPLPMLGGGGMFGAPAGGKLGAIFAGNGAGTILGNAMGSRGRSMFELPKSVPSTPIMLGAGGGGGGDGSCQDIPRMFQFSPEPSRDFLINGNSVDRSKSSSAASASNFYSSTLGSVSGGSGGGSGLTGGTTGLGVASVTSVTDANGNVVSGSELTSLPTQTGGVSVSGGNGVRSSCTMHSTGSAGNHHHHASGAHPEPPTADMANLTDGIEGLSSDLDAVTDSMIDSDILQNL